MAWMERSEGRALDLLIQQLPSPHRRGAASGESEACRVAEGASEQRKEVVRVI